MFSKKRLGQNFLVNSVIAKKIISALDISDSDVVVEIGPGKGVFTKFIIEKTRNAYFVELDKTLYELLKCNLKCHDKLINADVLKLDFSKLSNGQKIKIIGNFPYNISGKLIFKFYENINIIDRVVGIFQKEVVDRLLAGPGCKSYGIPSIFTQCYYNVKKLFDIDPSNFAPRPKIQSTVFRLDRNNVVDLGCDERLFTKIVKLAFSSRRKTIKNNFKNDNLYKYIDNKYLHLRAERLSISDFVNITKSIKNRIKIPRVIT